MRIKEILESPQLVGATDFGLTDISKNSKLANQLLHKIQEVIDETDDYTLFRTGNLENGYVAMIDKKDNLIKYIIKYQSAKSSKIGKTVTQVALWRNIKYPYVNNITKKIFFDYLLKKFPAIVSDTEQSERGKEFWVGRMSQATTLGLKVAFYNQTKNQLDWYDKNNGTIEDWLSFHTDKWSTEDSSKYNRFIISN